MLFRVITVVSAIFAIMYNSFVYEYDWICNILAFLNIIMSLVLFPLMKNYSYALNRLYVIFYIFFSSIIFAATQFIGDKASWGEYKELAIFSNNLMFFALLPISIHYYLFARKLKAQPFQSVVLLSKRFIKIFQIFIYVLSAISMVLGIGVMGANESEVVYLPFKIGGVIQLFRTDVAPIVILMIIYSFKQNKEEIDKKDYLIFILWGIFEMLVRMSKSAMLTTLLPIALYFIIGKYVTKKIMLKVILPICVFLLVSYSVVEPLRHMDAPISVSAIGHAYDISRRNAEMSDQNTFEKIYLRVLMNGHHYIKAYPYVGENDYQFDFTRLPLCVLLGGSAGYMTYYVDGFREHSGHSSGTTGIMDALLIGGYSLCYITIFLFGLFSIFIDATLRKGKVLYFVFFTIIFIDVVRGLSYSYFLAPDGFAFIVIKTFIFYILYRYSKLKPDGHTIH